MPFFVITSRNLCWSVYWVTLPFSNLPPAWFPSLSKIKIQLEPQQLSGLYARWPVTRTFGEEWTGWEFSDWDHNADLSGWEGLSCVLTYSIDRNVLNFLAGLKKTFSGWVTPLGKPISQLRDSIARKKKKEKPLIKEQKQNKSNACLVWGPGTTLFSSPHKLNRFNCLFICQSQPVQGDSGEGLGGSVWSWSCYWSQHLQRCQLCTISTAHIH